jgi:hypothetical protein
MIHATYPKETQNWLASLLFPYPGSVQSSSADSQIGEHLPGHGVECLDASSRLEHGADVAEVGFVPGSKRQHDVS